MSTVARVETFVGPAVRPHLAALAELRIAVFRDWPYLYDGDLAYEAKYLEAYARSPDSLFVLAFDGARVIGASSGIPLADDEAHFQAPFRARGIEVGTVFYCGESVLLPAYRGLGLGHRFFDEREAHARRLGRFRWIAFCAVDREAVDPRRPAAARANDAFWTKRGYVRQDGMQCRLPWPEIGGHGEVMHTLTFWLRPLDAAPGRG